MRRKFVRTISLVALAVAPGAGSLWAQSSDVSYGEVTKVAQVDVGGGSEAATVGGSLLGGVTGYVLGKGSSPGKKRRAMAAGAAAGGLIGNRATRGTNKGFEYTVRLSDGRSVSIVTEQAILIEYSSTIVIPPFAEASVDAYGNVILDIMR